jgi:hydrogenase/urease accessory protein HupE
MKKLWDCRRTFLSFVAILGLLLLMAKNPDKDYAFEIVGLAGGIGFINAWEKKKKNEHET